MSCAVRKLLDLMIWAHLKMHGDSRYARVHALRYLRAGLDYQSIPSDIFICSYPKSGTTWMQMILYQLASNGSMEIDHLNSVSPYAESVLLRCGGGAIRRLRQPVVLKTHLPYVFVPKGDGRYIYVVRHGMDVAVSYYYHYRRYNNYCGTFEEFLDRFLERGRLYPHSSWFSHVAEYAANPSHLNMIFVRFEDLVTDLETSVRRIASFCGFSIGESQLPRVLARSSFSFMREHERRIEPVPQSNVPRGNEDGHFIRRGRIGESATYMTDRLIQRYEREFDRWIRDAWLADYRRLPV